MFTKEKGNVKDIEYCYLVNYLHQIRQYLHQRFAFQIYQYVILHIHVYARTCVCACVCLCAYVCAYVCLCGCVHVCLAMYRDLLQLLHIGIFTLYLLLSCTMDKSIPTSVLHVLELWKGTFATIGCKPSFWKR